MELTHSYKKLTWLCINNLIVMFLIMKEIKKWGHVTVGQYLNANDGCRFNSLGVMNFPILANGYLGIISCSVGWSMEEKNKLKNLKTHLIFLYIPLLTFCLINVIVETKDLNFISITE